MRRLRLRRRRQGGWILLSVLGILLLLLLIVAGLYTASESQLITTKAVAGQQLAVQRAEQGLQVAMGEIRGGSLLIQTSMNYCNAPLASDCPPTDRISIAPVNNGNTAELRDNGGLQYEYHIVRRQQPGAPITRFVIQSVGFYGYAGSRNLITAVVEADVDLGFGNQGVTGAGNSY